MVKELHGPYPGDELLPSPRKIITHAITILAPATTIWPWLVQMGAGRAGWYSYDWIDNGGRPSVKSIIPALQHLQVGDLLPAIPGKKDSFLVREVQPGRALIFVVPLPTALENPDTWLRLAGPLRVSWALILETINPGYTRLISRGRI